MAGVTEIRWILQKAECRDHPAPPGPGALPLDRASKPQRLHEGRVISEGVGKGSGKGQRKTNGLLKPP